MTAHIRKTLALAHHRFYCVFGKADECSEIDDSDYDFADFAMQLFAETAPPIFVYSEAFAVPLEDPADKGGGEHGGTQLGLAQVANESPAGGRGPLTDSPEGGRAE